MQTTWYERHASVYGQAAARQAQAGYSELAYIQACVAAHFASVVLEKREQVHDEVPHGEGFGVIRKPHARTGVNRAG